MDPEIAENKPADAPAPDKTRTKPTCPECGATDISITPVPGLWLQFWCDACDHWWWETQDGIPITPAG